MALTLRNSQLTNEEENSFLAILFIDIRLEELRKEKARLEERKKDLIARFSNDGGGKYNGWRSVCDDAQEIKDAVIKG